MMIRLPGRCPVCGNALVWTGKQWKSAGQLGLGRHACPVGRPTCGVMMPNAKERCARKPGHTTEHRTRYSMDNALDPVRWTATI